MTGNDPDPRLGTSGGRAFVVDDDAITREIIAAHVERLGLTPVEVSPDRSAILSAAESAGPDDVLILDIILGPELEGAEVIRMLGGCAFRGRLMIVSGFGEDYLGTLESLATALSIRVAGTLSKPIRADDLKRCLRR